MPPVAMETKPSDPEALKQQIDAQGAKVRDLKGGGADKVCEGWCHVTVM